MIPAPINKILIEEGADRDEQTRVILKRLNNTPFERIRAERNSERGDFMDMDKKTLRLLHFKGEFIKPCPGTKGYICCGYIILHAGTNCPLDCSYCILQTYFNQPSLRVFVNLQDELSHIGYIIDSHPERMFRIGTGEFTDSLALDHITDWSKTLACFIRGRKNAVLEFKTKTDQVRGLLSSPYRERIIVSWSLNSPYIASGEEHGAPSVEKRLQAAKECQKEGIVIGFHFDPLIRHAGWREGYLRTIEMLDRYVDPNRIIWISLGCLRYTPALKSIIRRRQPRTDILDGEFIHGLDGKMRYFKPLRIETYSFLREQIGKWAGDYSCLYLCMESDDVWREGIGWSPQNTAGLSSFLDSRVRKLFRS
jgi:spore photoproduct lyase